MIIGTAGHIDHGKSALVTALTGRTVDRLAEEKRRGITIELNFAPLVFEGLPPVGIVDVPGHEDFVRTMVAGASGIDLVLLVVDLVEGPRPQTEEHLSILEQLRIPRGIPVFTKADLVEPEWAELVVADLAPRLARSPVAFGPAAVVSARTGQGVAELRERLRQDVVATRERSRDDGFRMPVDRVFSMAGIGTVVTGTVWTGTARLGDGLRVLPAGAAARLRSVESYGEPREAAEAATRTALGLTGIDRGAIGRGDTVVDQRLPWTPTSILDAVIDLLAAAPRPLASRTRLRVHLGTAEVLARVYPRGTIAAGSRGLARLVLETPAVARGGDRLVLRSYSPVTTIGGGRVLDPEPPRGASWPESLAAEAAPARLAALVARRRRGLPVERIPLCLGVAPAEVQGAIEAAPDLVPMAGGLFTQAGLAQREARVLRFLQTYHAERPTERGPATDSARQASGLDPAAGAALLDRLEARGLLVRRDGAVALPLFSPTVEGGAGAVERLLQMVTDAGLEPPTTAELAERMGIANLAPLVRRCVESGAIAAVERDRYFATAALDRFRQVLDELGAAGPMTPAVVRQRLGLSRKFLIPLLEWADRQGITRREGDARVLVRRPGP